ncbi:hypothetical protein DH09_16580 [Bacillaceae bacterium JMAK1]|nr:hypothetical protein DH09_16580 [Bacillaceae bacterium JMAK1]
MLLSACGAFGSPAPTNEPTVDGTVVDIQLSDEDQAIHHLALSQTSSEEIILQLHPESGIILDEDEELISIEELQTGDTLQGWIGVDQTDDIEAKQKDEISVTTVQRIR